MCELKKYYTAQELMDLSLPSLPTTKKAILKKAERENWQHRPRKGKGGGVEYKFNSLSQAIQAEILLKTAKSANKSGALV